MSRMKCALGGPVVTTVGTKTYQSSGFTSMKRPFAIVVTAAISIRSEEHTSELQSLMRISYAVFCLKKKRKSQKPGADTHATHHVPMRSRSHSGMNTHIES